MPRPLKKGLALGLDSVLLSLTFWLALCLRLEQLVLPTKAHGTALFLSFALAFPLFANLGLYRAVFRYSGWNTMMVISKALAWYALAFGLALTVIGLPGVPRSVGVIQPLLMLVALGLSRSAVRYFLGIQPRKNGQPTQHSRGVLVYGAGSAGQQMAAALRNANGPERLLGFLDDDPKLQGLVVNGWPVHSPAQLDDLVPRLSVTDVLLAMPSANAQSRLAVLDKLRGYPVRVRNIPGLGDLMQHRLRLEDADELDLNELLGRPPVAPNESLLRHDLSQQVVMVTGAGGSIGSELCRQIFRAGAKKLLLVDNSEFALYRVHAELETYRQQLLLEAEQLKHPDLLCPPQALQSLELVPLLASVCSRQRMQEIMRAFAPSTVYHAAAYKHVPLVEHNPAEGVRNNVWGTWICAEAALQAGVKRFVLVSTDKAVRPTNVMGASKRLAEMVLQVMERRSAAQPKPRQRTCFAMVRFGNVLGSSGSVVPLFRQQIQRGGPITLTHAQVTRYFMTIPEAAQLVIQAGAMAQGGEVFLLDMGQPVKIYDLARRMVELHGLRLRTPQHPHGDIAIEVTGLRPGEKLYEELLIGDNPMPTDHPRIMKAQEEQLSWEQLMPQLQLLDAILLANDTPAIKAQLAKLVQGYKPSPEETDWVHLAQQAAPTLPQETSAGLHTGQTAGSGPQAVAVAYTAPTTDQMAAQ